MEVEEHRRSAVLAVLCVVLFVTFLDNTIVSVTLAAIQSELHVGVQTLQWVVNGYALAFASLMLVGGMLGDLYGRRKVMLGGIALFSAGSVIAAVAPTDGWLLAGRVVMGVGAAGSEPGTLSIIRHVYEDRARRAKAMGIWAAVSGTALAMGPVIAGVLVGLWSWREVFWFNLILGAVAFVATLALVPESSDPEGSYFDWLGATLGASALALFVFAVIDGEQAGYDAGRIIALFAVAGVCAAGFVFVELRRERPMLDLRLFARPRFGVSNLVAFTKYFGIFSVFFFVALYLQLIANQSPFGIALDFLPMAAIMIVASALTGRWVARAGAKVPMTIGCVASGLGILVVDAVLGPDVGFARLWWSLAIAGAGFGIGLVPVVSAAMDSVEEQHSGMAASATNTSRELGAVIGVAVLGAIVNAQLTADLRSRLESLGIPGNFQSVVIEAVTHGGVPANAQAAASQNSAAAAAPELVEKVIGAAEGAFYTGLHTALLIAACLLLGSAVIVWFGFTRAEAREAGMSPSKTVLTYLRAGVLVVVVAIAAVALELWIGPTRSESPTATASAPAPAASSAQSPQGPTMTVTPSTGLRDGDQVHVAGSGFTSGANLVVIQCAGSGDDVSADDCDIADAASVVADGSGGVATTATVHSGPFGAAGRTCGGGVECLIVVSQPSASAGAERATAPVSFASGA